MTDDIVDRLCELHERWFDDPTVASDIEEAMKEIEDLRDKLLAATVDIVTRLRNETDDFRIFGLAVEAADEIERLRKAIVDYVMTISDCYATPATDSDALELLKQAVRGD